MNKTELIKQLEKFDDDAEVVIPWRTRDDLMEIETVQINEYGQIIIRP